MRASAALPDCSPTAVCSLRLLLLHLLLLLLLLLLFFRRPFTVSIFALCSSAPHFCACVCVVVVFVGAVPRSKTSFFGGRLGSIGISRDLAARRDAISEQILFNYVHN